MTTSELVLTTDHGAVRVLTLNRPSARNALSRDLIRAALRRADRRRRRRRGARRRAHRRRPGVLRRRRPQRGCARWLAYFEEFRSQSCIAAVAEMRTPVVGAINGADVHRRPGDGAGLRLPGRLGAGGVRRHPCPGGHPARRRDDRAAAAGGRRGDGAAVVDDR